MSKSFDNGMICASEQAVIVDEEISIGDYVLTGGEIPAMVLIDSVSRYIDGVLTRRFHRRRKFLKWTFRVSSIYKTRRI